MDELHQSLQSLNPPAHTPAPPAFLAAVKRRRAARRCRSAAALALLAMASAAVLWVASPSSPHADTVIADRHSAPPRETTAAPSLLSVALAMTEGPPPAPSPDAIPVAPSPALAYQPAALERWLRQ